MTFVSYAQNFEDVMLWRALKNIHNGFYIDVGANDPEEDSVTKAFYDQGWNGINIEPLSMHHDALVAARARDINLKCAVGATRGELELWECDVRGWATLDQAAMQQHERNGYAGRLQTVPVMTLTEIFSQYVSGDVHFLKIDVEGFEKAVLEGTNFSVCRPWVIVIEATQPDSTVEVHKQWENLLLVRNYQFAYADGLNRYYVADEHQDLLPNFGYPPNVFDEFVLADVIEAETRAAQSRTQALEAESQLDRANQQIQAAKSTIRDAEVREQNVELHLKTMTARALQAEQQLAAVYASSSWRITRPIRAFKRVLQHPPAAIGMVRNAARRSKHAAKTTILRVARFLVAQPQVRKAAVRTLARYPSLDAKMRKLASRIQSGPGHAGIDHGNPYEHTADPDQHALPQSARKVLAALQRGADKNNLS